MNPQITISITTSPEGARTEVTEHAASATGLPQPSAQQTNVAAHANGTSLPAPDLDVQRTAQAQFTSDALPGPQPLEQLEQASRKGRSSSASSVTTQQFSQGAFAADAPPSPMPLEELERAASQSSSSASKRGGKSNAKSKGGKKKE